MVAYCREKFLDIKRNVFRMPRRNNIFNQTKYITRRTDDLVLRYSSNCDFPVTPLVNVDFLLFPPPGRWRILPANVRDTNRELLRLIAGVGFCVNMKG